MYNDLNGNTNTLTFNSTKWNMFLCEDRCWFVQNKTSYPKISYEFNIEEDKSIYKIVNINSTGIHHIEYLGDMYE